MIRAVILDIDGVIIGEKVGFNSPHPHAEVIKALQRVKKSGIPIILCTAKPHFSISDIILPAKLDNPHITDAGAVLIDSVRKTILKEYDLDTEIIEKIISVCLKNDVYVELYTTKTYAIQRSQVSEGITPKHAFILQQEPTIVEDIQIFGREEKITKIMPIAQNEVHKQYVHSLLSEFAGEVTLSWGLHPVALPLQFGIITDKHASKVRGAEEILASLHTSFADVLGVGDSLSDWQFMEKCEYVGTVANAPQELQALVQKRSGVVGKSVDENGILDIFTHFNL